MNLNNLKRILIAVIAVVVAWALISLLFKALVWAFFAGAILVVAAIIYSLIAVKLKRRAGGTAGLS